MLTASNLRQIMPNIPQDKFEMYLMILNRVMQEDEIDTPLRASAFLAQLAHESGQLKFMEEIWGPTAAQKRYEPPSTLATKLGNTQPGDGKRFKGRGPIQITGRTNYKRFGDLLGVDLIRNPDLAATPQIGFQIAGTYWKVNGLNELADIEDFITITRRINGGLNGLAERQKYYAIAKNTLGAAPDSGDFTIASASVGLPRGGSVRSSPGLAFTDPEENQGILPPLELPRGYEAILEDQNTTPTASPSRPNAESKKKSARRAARPNKKSVSKKSIKKGVKKVAKASAKKASKKTAKKVVSKAIKTAPSKSRRSASKKSAKQITKKATVKSVAKPARKATSKAGKKKVLRIIIVKATTKSAKKPR